MLEGFLISLCLYIILFKRQYNPKKKGFGARPPDKLTEEEIDDLVEEWKPEPLLASLPKTNALTKRSDVVVEEVKGAHVKVRGMGKQRVVNFASFDFLNVATEKSVKDSAIKILDSHGCGSCGPRGFYGTFDSHLNLENALAKFYGTEAAIIYSDTVSTSSSVIPAFAKRGDLIVADEGISAPLLVGLRLSRAKIVLFKHNDMKDLREKLEDVAEKYRRQGRKLEDQKRFIVVEGLYRDHADFAPLRKIVDLKKEFKYRVVVDDSYGCFACGKTGRGVLDHARVGIKEVDIFVGSMATTLGSVGGFCASTNEIVGHQRLSGAGYCFSASQPPFTAESARVALDMFIAKPDSERRQKLVENIAAFRSALKRVDGVDVIGDDKSPITYVRLDKKLAKRFPSRDKQECLLEEVSDIALSNGFLFRRAIFRPHWSLKKNSLTTPVPPAALRLTVSCAHTKSELEGVVDALTGALQKATSSSGASKEE